ncbi:MAG: hypothetical protein R3F56_06550 [Planctomycetota bacterium]
MSPIGRIFIVLNLGLAFGFVAIAGTYLKNSTNWKQKYDTATADADTASKKMAAEMDAVRSELEGAKNNLTAYTTNLKGTETRFEEAKAENERLTAQIGSFEGSIKASESSLKSIKDALESATTRADDAYKMSVKASDERNEALNARVKAEDDLRTATAKIAELENTLAETNARVARLQEEVGEKETLLAYVRVNNGGLLPNPVPAMSGSIVTVGRDGRLLTAKLDSKAGEPKPGHNLAIHANGHYKGEFVVDTVEGDYLFGRLIRSVDGAVVGAGDKVDSQPGR